MSFGSRGCVVSPAPAKLMARDTLTSAEVVPQFGGLRSDSRMHPPWTCGSPVSRAGHSADTHVPKGGRLASALSRNQSKSPASPFQCAKLDPSLHARRRDQGLSPERAGSPPAASGLREPAPTQGIRIPIAADPLGAQACGLCDSMAAGSRSAAIIPCLRFRRLPRLERVRHNRAGRGDAAWAVRSPGFLPSPRWLRPPRRSRPLRQERAVP